MGYVTALFAVLIRLLRPSCGVHVSPFGYFRELVSELAAIRRRLRRSAQSVPALVEATPAQDGPREEATPLVPLPFRKPADARPRTVFSAAVPVEASRDVQTPAALVRGYYRDWEERRQAEQREADRIRRAAAVLLDAARVADHAEVAA